MGEGKQGLGGFPLGERGKISGIWDRATDFGEMRHSPALSTFDAPRTHNLNIGKNIGF